MDQIDLSLTIAQNITELRRKNSMTQAELAERLGYSDKSVSKWERAEGTPDIICLKKISDTFGVTVDYLLQSEHPEKEAVCESMTEKTSSESYSINHLAVSFLSVAGVWLLAITVFVILKLCTVVSYLPFVIALPVTAIVLIVFNSLWGKRILGFFAVTFLVWSILFLICYIFRGYSVWLLMTLGVPATVVVFLSYRVKITKK